MELNDIRIFREIARTGNISTAAYALFSTQSTVSRRLGILESELNLRLFERGRGLDRVHLTPSGERFLPIAEQMLALEQQARLLQNERVTHQVSIAAPDSIASYLLKDFFREIAYTRPEWDLKIIMQDSLPICEMLVNHTMDIGITNGEYPFSELRTRELFREDFVVLTRCPELGQHEVIHPRELDGSHEIFEVCSPEYERWHNYWWQPGQAKITVNLAQFAADLLREEKDWAILPRSVAAVLRPADGYIVELAKPAPSRVCHYVVPRAQRPEQAEISEMLFLYMQQYLQRAGLAGAAEGNA